MSKTLFWITNLTIFLLPTYLLRFKIFGFPTNLWEVLMGGLLLGGILKWGFKRIYEDKKGFRRKLKLIFSLIFKKNCLLLIGILLLVLGTIISTVISQDIYKSLGILKSWFILPILFGLIIISTQLRRYSNTIIFLKSLALSGTIVSMIAIFYLILGIRTYDSRLKAFYEHPNHLAMYLAPCWLIAYGLWLMAKNAKQKKLWLASIVLISIPLSFAYSYGAWLGIMGGMILLWGYRRIYGDIKGHKDRKRKWLYCYIVILLIVIIALTQLNQPKFQNIFETHRSSFHSRIMIWRSALYILKDNWLLGIGPGIFQKYYLDYQKYFPPYLEWAVPQPHNIFLAFWLQTGIMGFVGFILILVWFFGQGIKGIHGLKGLDGDKKRAFMAYGSLYSPFGFTALVLMAIMTYTLIHGLVDTTYWKNDLSVIWWTVVTLMITIQGTKEIKRSYGDK